MPHEPLTHLDQEQLDWIGRFADQLRIEAPRFAAHECSDDANEIARDLWERAEWRALEPGDAAHRWLEQRERR